MVGLVLVLVVVAGSAYALFSSSLSLNGMVLGTATANLRVSADGVNYYSGSLNMLSLPPFALLLPGETDWREIWLNNNSTTDKLNMNLSAKITATGGNWPELKDAVQLRVCVYNSGFADNCDGGNATAWHTLNDWNASAIALPGPLNQGDSQHYTLVFALPSSYGNGVSGMSITGMNFEVTGTQIP